MNPIIVWFEIKDVFVFNLLSLFIDLGYGASETS